MVALCDSLALGGFVVGMGAGVVFELIEQWFYGGVVTTRPSFSRPDCLSVSLAPTGVS